MKKIIICLFSIILLLSFAVIESKANMAEDDGKKIILIDPGHGGIDGGANPKMELLKKILTFR